MNLLELLTSPLPDVDTLRSLGIVFDTEMAQKMVNYHAWHGDPRCTVFPAALADGRWCHTADILPDCIAPDGGYHAGFVRLDATNFSQVEIIPLAELEFAAPPVAPLVPEENPEPEPAPQPEPS